MKIKELIEKLQKLQIEHGPDIDVSFENWDNEGGFFSDIKDVKFVEEKRSTFITFSNLITKIPKHIILS